MRTYEPQQNSEFVNADNDNNLNKQKILSNQDSSLSWNQKAKNVLVTYDKTRTLTSGLLLEIISLIDNKEATYYDENGNVIDPTIPNFSTLTGQQIRDKLQALENDDRLDASSIKNLVDNIFISVGDEQISLQTYLDSIFGFENVVQNLDNPSNDTVISTAGLQAILTASTNTSQTFTFGDDFNTTFTFDHTLNNQNVIFVIKHDNKQVIAWPTSMTTGQLVFDFVIAPQPDTTITIFSSMQAPSQTFTFGDSSQLAFEFTHGLGTSDIIFVIRQNANQIFAWPTTITNDSILFEFLIPPEPNTVITIFK